jgi:hypothetical protein
MLDDGIFWTAAAAANARKIIMVSTVSGCWNDNRQIHVDHLHKLLFDMLEAYSHDSQWQIIKFV